MSVPASDTLVVIIEASAGLAGFAGIVATLRREAWTRLDSLQIHNLLSSAFSALFISIIALVLIHADIALPLTWALLSGLWLVVGLLFTAKNARDYGRLAKSANNYSPAMPNFFWFGTVLLVLALQAYNVLVLREFWPLLVGISWLFGLTCHSFWQLLVRHR